MKESDIQLKLNGVEIGKVISTATITLTTKSCECETYKESRDLVAPQVLASFFFCPWCGKATR